MAVVSIWTLMSVYAKIEYNIAENQFGLIATTNKCGYGCALAAHYQKNNQRVSTFPDHDLWNHDIFCIHICGLNCH
jgi:hypothetical protein